MYRIPLHKPSWIHGHKPDWHAVGVHFGHLVHDPRFWAAIALIILLGLIISAMVFSKVESATTRPWNPVSPYVPYMP
jgi:hypothetical protein